MTPEKRLEQLGLVLPPVVGPAFNYVPWRISGGQLYLSGHGPRLADGSYRAGKLGQDLDIEQGYADARQTGLHLIATAKAALGELSRINAIVKLFGMVNALPDFHQHPQVINGCSDLFVEVFGDKGRHSRSAVGMGSLPMGMSVEIEAIFDVG